MPKVSIVYRAYDAEHRLLYVGLTSSSMRTRMALHKSKSEWFVLCSRVSEEKFDNRRAAEEAERLAIINEKPLFNKVKLIPGAKRWQDVMTDRERDELAALELAAEAAAGYLRGLTRLLKDRCIKRQRRQSAT